MSNSNNEITQEPTTDSPNYDTLMSILPKHEGAWSFPLRLYQNFWVPEHLLRDVLTVQEQFKPRPTDIILATMPKSGTTWLKALAFAITNRHRYSFAEHPLLVRNPHECVPFLEISHDGDDTNVINKLEKYPSPRLLATHMPTSMLPATLIDSGCRIVFLCRDPKDVLVSWWQFDMKNSKNNKSDINQAFELYCDGVFPHGPFWDLVLDYWKESLKRPTKVMFLRYEELIDDACGTVRRLAEFLGFPFEEEEVRNGVLEQVVRLCSFERMSQVVLENNSKKDTAAVGGRLIDLSAFFRNGKVGDWKNYISVEMAKKLDGIIEQKLHGSGLVF